MPIHCFAFSGSTRNAQTVSGVASIASSRSTAVVSVAASMLRPLLSFGFTFERFEPVVPEVVEERLQRREARGARAIQAARPVASFAHELRLLQERQVLRDRRPRHVEVRRDLARRELVVPDEGEDPAPPGSGDRLQRGFHADYCKESLTLDQANIR